MNLRQAAWDALNALETGLGESPAKTRVITALRAALAEPEQEAIGTVTQLFTLAAQEKFDLRGSTKIYLAPTPRKPEPVRPSFAGVTMWRGDATVTQCVTKTEIEHERIPGMILEMAADKCAAMLAAHGQGEIK